MSEIKTKESWEVEVFYDGDCPLCRREIDWMRGRDRQGKIRMTNIADPTFSAASYGLTFDDFMAEIQGRLPDGTWLKGVEVFRRLYTALGFGWVVGMTRLPPFPTILNWGYQAFARRRLKLTGRCSVDSTSCRN